MCRLSFGGNKMQDKDGRLDLLLSMLYNRLASLHLEVRKLNHRLERKEQMTSAQLAALQAAIKKVQDSETAEMAAVQATVQAVGDEITRVEAVIAALKASQGGGDTPDPVVDQAISDLETVNDNLTASVTSLSSTAGTLAGEQPAVPPAPTPVSSQALPNLTSAGGPQGLSGGKPGV